MWFILYWENGKKFNNKSEWLQGGIDKDKDSSVSDYSKRFGHEIDWNNVEIIDVARSNMHLLWKEMLHIYKDKLTMNKQLKSELFCLLIGQKTKDNI